MTDLPNSLIASLPLAKKAIAKPKSKARKIEHQREIEHKLVSANGIDFHVAIAKRARSIKSRAVPPILCLHGFPEGWQSWRGFMEHFPEATIYAPDLRGYPSKEFPQERYPNSGYDVFTLTEDVHALISALKLKKPILLSHDWGGALGWIFAHRYSEIISQLIVVNCTHPKTLVRAVLHFDDWQTFRIPWVPPFQVPILPELLLSTCFGRKLLELSFTLRAGPLGEMDRETVKEVISRFQSRKDLFGAIEYYRAIIKTLLFPTERKKLEKIYQTPITVPTTLIWGMTDRALSAKVAQRSELDAGRKVIWRPLPDIGHFVDLEAPQKLAEEVRRIL